MNPAEVATALVVEETLGKRGSYRKVDERLYVIKQGSSYVMINIVPWEEERALVRVAAQLVKGVRMTGELAEQLLHLNLQLRFGAFAYDPHDSLLRPRGSRQLALCAGFFGKPASTSPHRTWHNS